MELRHGAVTTIDTLLLVATSVLLCELAALLLI